MSDDLHEAIGEANGKLDMLIKLVRDHVQQDDRRFAEHDAEIKALAADINKAKGAAVFLATLVSVSVAAIAKLFGH